jgi:hypothetical protein
LDVRWKLFQTAHVLVGQDQHVAVVIGIEIEDHEGILAAEENIVLVIFLSVLHQLVTENAFIALLVTKDV